MSNGNGQWKWLAGILAALILGAFPGCVAFWRSPTRADFDAVQQNQAELIERVAILETQNIALIEAMRDTQQRVILLQTQR